MKLLKSTKGMTLVEIIVSLALLGLVGIGMMGFFTDSFKFQSRNQQLAVTQRLADETIESFKNDPLQSFEDENGNDVDITKMTVGGDPKVISDAHDGYTTTIKVNSETKSSEITIYDITVTVTSNEQQTIIGTVNSSVRVSNSDISGGGAGGTRITTYTLTYKDNESDKVFITKTLKAQDNYLIDYKAVKGEKICTSWTLVNEDGTLSNDTYNLGETISIERNTTLVAAGWKKATGKYYLTLQNNGVTASIIEYKVGTVIPLNAGVDTGYTWDGWYYGDGSLYNKNQSTTFIMPSNDVILNAKSNSDSTGTAMLKYDKNTTDTVTNMPTNPAAQTLTATNTSHTFTVSDLGPQRAGYTFLGWSTTASATSADVGATVEVGNETVTLYAVWKEDIVEYTITYHANGGTGIMDTQKSVAGSSVTLTANTFTYSGKTFQGWATSASGSVKYEDGKTIDSLNSNLNLYAVWKEDIVEYTITYHANGGTGTMTPQKAAAGSSVTLTTNTFTYSGKTFQGWATSASGSKAYEDKATINSVNNNIDLYAVWKTNMKYNCACNACNVVVATSGSYCSNCTSDICEYCGYCKNHCGGHAECKCTACTVVATKNGYCNECWNRIYDANDTTVNNSCASCESCENHCICVKKVSLIYDANGGIGAPLTETKDLTSSMVEFTVSTVEPTREGYELLGWAETSTAITQQYIAGDKISISKNKTIYAIWKQIYNCVCGGCSVVVSTSGEYCNNCTSPICDTCANCVVHCKCECDHVMDTGVREKEPTCIEKGITKYTCTKNCGYYYTLDDIEALGHLDEDVWETTEQPTCTKTGTKVKICQRSGCGATLATETIAALGHEWKETSLLPTCTEKGSWSRECQREGCNKKESGEEDALGHLDKDVWETTEQPTCTKTGTKVKICQRSECGATLATATIAALGHLWPEEYEVAESTNENKQHKLVHTCQRSECDAQEEKYDNCNFTVGDESWVKTSSTKHKYTSKKCDICSGNYTESQNHSYEITQEAVNCTEKGTKTCINCAYSKSYAGDHDYRKPTYTIDTDYRGGRHYIKQLCKLCENNYYPENWTEGCTLEKVYFLKDDDYHQYMEQCKFCYGQPTGEFIEETHNLESGECLNCDYYEYTISYWLPDEYEEPYYVQIEDYYTLQDGTFSIISSKPMLSNYTFKGWDSLASYDGVVDVVSGSEQTLSWLKEHRMFDYDNSVILEAVFEKKTSSDSTTIYDVTVNFYCCNDTTCNKLIATTIVKAKEEGTSDSTGTMELWFSTTCKNRDNDEYYHEYDAYSGIDETSADGVQEFSLVDYMYSGSLEGVKGIVVLTPNNTPKTVNVYENLQNIE